MQSFRLIGRLGGAAVGALLLALCAGHQPALADEPTVARLSVVTGDVAIRRGDSNATYAAAINAPLMASDYLSTGSGESRAEIQFDYGDFLRLGANVQMRLSQLDPSGRTVQLADGTVELSELHAVAAAPEIDTPSVAVRAQSPGAYRVSVNHDGTTLVSVRSGSVVLAGTSVSQTIFSGQTVAVSGSPSNPQFQPAAVLAYDSFDAWNQSRDSFDGNDAGYQYASNQMVGIPDLSAYGSWSDNSQYGYGWTPNAMGSNWAPYEDGQWTWEPYYGYTWVGSEPWGWAPYHYGTWLYNSNAWTWYPNAGPQYPSGAYPYVGTASGYGASYYGNGYPYYGTGYPPYATGYPYGYGYPYATPNTSSLLWAPALVTFLGLLGGQGVDTALLNGAGSLAWTPLAPGELAYPWYGPQQAAWYGYPSYGYQTYVQPYVQSAQPATVVNSYTRYNITKIYRIYRNTRAPHGVMIVSTKAFRDGQFRNIRAESLGQTRISNVAVFRNVVPVAPTTSNLRFTSRPGPTRIAAIAPRIAMFKRFPEPKQQPAQFAGVRQKVEAATTRLYAAHPSMPGPVLARKTVTAPKPPAAFLRKTESTARKPIDTLLRAPQATQVHKPAAAQVRKPAVTQVHAPKPAAPQHVSAPQHVITPQHVTAPQHVNGSTHEAAPEHLSAPAHVTAPEHVTRPEAVQPRPAPAEHPYSAPAEHPYSAPAQHQYSAPAEHPYSAPAQRQYSAPQHQYSAPAHQYSAPVEHHPAPPPAQPHQPQSHPAPQGSGHGSSGKNNNNDANHHGGQSGQ